MTDIIKKIPGRMGSIGRKVKPMEVCGTHTVARKE
ncbi:MAG: hydrogenase formation protein HypD [Nitrospirae bacterium]|nr:hydrogenase formation protein HypD [Nitrospirota bacterium]